jgi:hypothetical protein
VGQGLLNIDTSRSHSDTPHLVRFLWTSDQPDAETSTWQHTPLNKRQPDLHAPRGIRIRNPSKRTPTYRRPRTRGHWITDLWLLAEAHFLSVCTLYVEWYFKRNIKFWKLGRFLSASERDGDTRIQWGPEKDCVRSHRFSIVWASLPSCAQVNNERNYFHGSYNPQLRRSLPEMRLDANAHHLMANDELLLPILLAFVPRLLNAQFTRPPLETPEVCAAVQLSFVPRAVQNSLTQPAVPCIPPNTCPREYLLISC